MEKNENLISYIESSIVRNWDLPALSDYKGATKRYSDVAERIERLHIVLNAAGIQKGDKIALCAKNSGNWGALFLGIITYGAVVVPILNDFTPEMVYNIVNHSDARILFLGDGFKVEAAEEAMPAISAVIGVEDLEIKFSKSADLNQVKADLDRIMNRRHPQGLTPEDIHYEHFDGEDIALINYTSGSTGQPKGVMLPYRALLANVVFAYDVYGDNRKSNVLSILPMAHMYGLAFEFLFEFCSGMHVHFLGKLPSPKIIAEAFMEVKPKVIILVPLILEKIVKKKVFPIINRPLFRILLKLPLVSVMVKKKIRTILIRSFGGNFKETIVGGAALNKDVEDFLNMIRFPYTVGYGMTECAPIIAYEWWDRFRPGSCGKAAKGMVLKIDSEDPRRLVGEILTKGDCLMKGYYKNEKATAEAIDAEGWLHTGDMGIIDREGNLFIKGRCKNMILGPSGQNIYPEEIESEISGIDLVAENIVIERNGKIVALIYPDPDAVASMGKEQVAASISASVKQINLSMPSFSKIAAVEFRDEEFEKTPKKSIRKFLYQ